MGTLWNATSMFVFSAWILMAPPCLIAGEAERAEKKASHTESPLPDGAILLRLYIDSNLAKQADVLAEQKADADETEEIAKKLLKDHATMIKEARSLAGRLSVKFDKVAVPATERQRRLRDRRQFKPLLTLEEAAFDQRYLAFIAAQHEQTLAFVQRQKTLLPKDSPLFDYLSKLLPALQDDYALVSSSPTAPAKTISSF